MHRTPLVLFSTAVLAVLAQPAAAQRAGNRAMGCGVEACQEAAIYSTALDTLMRHNENCAARNVAVLSTLHVSPLTMMGDNRRRIAQPGPHLVPSSPPVARLDDAVNPFRNFGEDVELVELEVARRGRLGNRCLVVFSTITWLGEHRVRLMAVASSPSGMRQLFYFLRRDDGDDPWKVDRIEGGWTS